jgi:hypothetical protein
MPQDAVPNLQADADRLETATDEAIAACGGNPHGRGDNRKAADPFAANVLPIVREMQATGATAHRAIVQALNNRGVRTVRGGDWHDSTVRICWRVRSEEYVQALAQGLAAILHSAST